MRHWGFSLSASLPSPDNGITAPFYLRNGVPGITATAPVFERFVRRRGVGAGTNTSVSLYDPAIARVTAEQFNFGIEHSLPGASMIRGELHCEPGRRLPSTTVSINQIPLQILGRASVAG